MTEQANSTPDIAIGMEIDDLVDEARNFLDGKPITSQGQADALTKIVRSIQDASKRLETERKAEKSVHDEAGKAVQARYLPVQNKAKQAIEVANAPLTVWLAKLAEEQRLDAERLRAEAEAQRQEAERLAAETREGDLGGAQEVEAAQANAARAERIANKASKQKAHAIGGGRAMGLRTSYEPELVDVRAAMNWAADRRKGEWQEGIKALLMDMAKQAVREGIRDVPGFTIHERKKAA